jgi:FixJ family two-component response regulator
MLPFLIAVVEDEEPVRKALSRLLRAAGLHTVTFEGGEAFLESLAITHPDCLILDLHMPGMSGLELMHELKARNIAIPVIMITAHDEPFSRRRCLDVGAYSYMRKPLDDAALLDAIAEAMGHRPAFKRQPASAA